MWLSGDSTDFVSRNYTPGVRVPPLAQNNNKMEEERIITKVTTVVTRGDESVEISVEEMLTQQEFKELKIEMKRVQFESDLAKELENNAAIIAQREEE